MRAQEIFLALECREVRGGGGAILLMALAACVQPSPSPSAADATPAPSPSVSILTERDLQHDADEIAAVTIAELRRNALAFDHDSPIRIISIAAVDPQLVRGVEPEAPRLEAAVTEPVWVVRALGTFGTFRGPTPEPRIAESGFFVFSDRDRRIVATGFP